MKPSRSTIKVFSLAIFMLWTVQTSPALAAPGDLDPSFGNGGTVSSAGFFGNALAIQANGKIVAAGNGLERYNPDGSLDTSFGIGGRVDLHGSVVPGCFDPRFGDACQFSPSSVGAAAIQSDGKIIVAGNGIIYVDEGMYDVWVFALTRYNTDGSLDASFGTGGRVITYGFAGEGGPRALAIQSDGKIVAAGYKRDNSWDFLTARYNSNGTLDFSFGSNGLVVTSFSDGPLGIDEANDVAIQSDGKIVAGGGTRTHPSSSSFALARYTIDGSLDSSFGTGGKIITPFGNSSGAKQIVIRPDGKIIAAGTGGDSPNTGFGLARYNTDGSLDNSFGTSGKVLTLFTPGYGGAGTVAIQSDGKIVASGYRYLANTPSLALARYYADGSLDVTFGSGGKTFTPFADVSVGNDAAIQPDGKIIVLASTTYPPAQYALFRYQAGANFTVANIEELYSAVNNPQNAGAQISIAPGVYALSVNDPNGTPRPNGGRLELQQNMSLRGVAGDRGAVIIDAMNLPAGSYIDPSFGRTHAIRMGRGTNAIEWLTARNAVNGGANIGTDLASTSTNIRIAHVASSNSERGLDIRNFGKAGAGRVINAEIIDNDFHNNQIGPVGAGLRIVNNFGADGGIINATLTGNRSYNNYLGLLVENNQSSDAVTTVISSGNRFFENGCGAVVGGGLSQGSNVANGNTVRFSAFGDAFENNNGFNNFDFGGLVIPGGENTSFPNGTSNNTVHVDLRNCRFGNNQVHDLAAFGARSSPASIGTPGTGNTVTIYLRGITPKFRTQVFMDSLPVSPGSMNAVVLTGLR